MTTSEITQIQQCLQQIRAEKLSERLAKQFPTVDLNQHRLGPFTAAQFINLIARLVIQFSDALETPDAALLSKGYRWESQAHSMTDRQILTVLQNLNSQIANAQWEPAAQHLELAIGYLIQNGFWDRGTKELHSLSKLKKAELFIDLETKAAQMKELLVVFGKHKIEYEQAVKKRESEAQAVTQQLATAQNHAAEITKLLGKSSNENGQLTQILVGQQTNLVKTNAELKTIDERKVELEGALKNAADRLTSSESRLKFMAEKSDWVNELAGTAAAGVLGQKFEARRRELAAAANWWLAGTVGSVILAAIWLGIAHKYFMHEGSNFWLTLALNFGLLLPPVFIIGFFGKQFSKIRHFEEEYAFRASIAMTLGAFADRLGEDKERHNKLITETVEKLYNLPVLLQQHEPSGWFSQRSTERMVKATTELVAAAKGPPKL